ncbi:MAG: CU044_2847 family protein [Chloroflexota bacterium]
MTTETPYHIVVELDEPEGGLQQARLNPAEAAEALAEKSEAAIRAALEKVKDIGEQVAATVKKISEPPTEATVEFGLKLGAEAGVIAEGTGEAHFVVTLKWVRK